MTKNNRIYSEDEEGKLVPMEPSEPLDENALQELIAKYPAIINEGDDNLLLVRREQRVRDAESSANRWSLDHLFVNPDAIPVLVEVKRARNPELRRKVVGQLLEYAANAPYWSPADLKGSFREACEKSSEDADALLEEFIGERSHETFWNNVAGNLRIGKMRLVIAADRIPSELRKIVEFLNDQMRAEVRAIEIGYFESSEGRKVLVPHVIGDIERSKEARQKMIFDEWKQEHFGKWDEQTRNGALIHFRIMENLGLKLKATDAGSGIEAYFDDQNSNTETSVKVFTLYDIDGEKVKVELKLRDMQDWFKKAKRQDLSAPPESTWLGLFEQFQKEVGKFTSKNPKPNGRPSFPPKLLIDPARKEKYEQFARDYINLAR